MNMRPAKPTIEVPRVPVKNGPRIEDKGLEALQKRLRDRINDPNWLNMLKPGPYDD